MSKDVMDRRVQKAVERILGDESLTSGLEDAPAKVLIDWGVAEVERRARLTAHIMNEDEASEVLDQAVSRVRRVMKRVAKAADRQGMTSREDLTRMLAQTLSEVEAAEAAPTPELHVVEELAPPKPVEVVLPSEVDLVAPAPPAVEEPPPVKEPTPPEPEDQGFLTRLRRFFGGDQP